MPYKESRGCFGCLAAPGAAQRLLLQEGSQLGQGEEPSPAMARQQGLGPGFCCLGNLVISSGIFVRRRAGTGGTSLISTAPGQEGGVGLGSSAMSQVKG